MDERAQLVAKGIAAGRVLYGLGCMAAPRTVMGPAGKRAEGQMRWMTRAFGVRDVVLGAGTLIALGGDLDAAVPWVAASAAADSLDVANSLVFHKELDRTGLAASLSLAVPASIGGWWATRGLRAA